MTESAHRSSESAHRSGGSELKTEVFFVKTSEDLDAVIVSFVDGGDVNGIYLYEPDAEPRELTSVGVNGVANEFELATVEGATVDGEEVEWPGDGMVTRAERDAAVEQATQDHANLQEAYDTLREQAQSLLDNVKRTHEEDHTGPFQWCNGAACAYARGVEL